MKAAIYVRKSTEQKTTDERELSTVRQAADCKAYCERKGWTVVATFDEGSGVSGTKGRAQRPQYDALLKAAEAGAFDVVVAWNADRLSREEPVDYLVAIRTLQKAKVKVFYADKDREEDLTKIEGLILAMLQSYRSNEEAKEAGNRTRAERADRFRKFEGWCQGHAPYGYRRERINDGYVNGKRTGHTILVKDPEQAAVVERIFTLVAEGKSLRHIRSILNAEGVPGPTRKQYKGQWATWSLGELLRNPAYIGEMRMKGCEPRHHEPLRIIKQPLWDKVQRILTKNAQQYAAHRAAHGRFTGRPEGGRLTQYLYSDLLLCGSCGSKMWIIPNRNHIYARCKSAVTNSTCSNKWGLPYATIRDGITKAIGQVRPEQIEQLYRAEHARAMANVGGLELSVTGKRREVDGLLVKIEKLTDAIEAGEDVGGRLKARKAELDAAQVELAELEGRRASEDISGFDWQDWQGWLQEAFYAPLESIHLQELEGNVEAGRLVLKLLLPNPVVVTPVVVEGKPARWTFKAELATDSLLGGGATESYRGAG